ncbi:hypothetical protein [Thalassospira xiamenensis]|uniref:Uncharacterized protein n=1 Tax=Thalassospira xiamenensis TaxID=220697 RepID=A0A367X5L9_9PROT|nr:hypothetical protein [Thalassospira xiamenensis]KZB53900.1 hypothetical protein AUP41_21100 [Thalassospira xiamenensis]MCK2165510.1 hypothetical protein [Thalassospira xiamenensis]RCK48380.1 hypothetical protein TH44_14655 [Thalassospira xiamenensis]
MPQPLSQAAEATDHSERNQSLPGLLRHVAFCLIACALVLFGGGTSITAKPLSGGVTFPYPFNTVNHDSGPSQAVLPVAPDRAIAGNRQTADDAPSHQPTFPDDAAIAPLVTSHTAAQWVKRTFVAGTIITHGGEILPVSPRAPPFRA